jgi:hypothetical protein
LRSQEEEAIRLRDQREGLSLLAQSPGFLGPLSFPAICYEKEIRELQELTDSLRKLRQPLPKAENWREEFSPEHREKILMAEAQWTKVEDWATKNLWAIPVEIPNSETLPYGLAWVSLPGGAMPKRLSEWQLVDPITGRKGTLLPVTMPAFQVEPDLWESVGIAVLKNRLMFEGVEV